MEFKIGDKIKLLKYDKYEYPNYKNLSAIIIDEGGYDFDWEIKWPNGDESYAYEENMKLVKSSNLKDMETTIDKAKYGVSYEVNGDPTVYFKTLKGANDKIQELLDDQQVDKNKIYLFEIKSLKKVVRPIKYELVEV
jgi:hypothetical protein